MPPSPTVTAEALASALAQLPSLSVASAELDSVRIAIARAIASGQDAGQLALDLNTPAGWQSVDFSKPPIPAKPGTTTTQSAMDSAMVTTPAAASAKAPPEWISTIVPVALAKAVSSRVLVLDREPTALGGLERPAWARALSPAATYGPVTIVNDLLQVTTTKWIHVFNFVEAVQFVRGTTVLCVLPISSSVTGSQTKAGISAGSAWMAAQPFAAAAPADGFAGITIQSGELTCDQALTFGGTMVTVPAGAILNLSLAPTVPTAGPAGFPAKVTAPTKIDATFPASGAASITFNQCSATLYGETIDAKSAALAAEYNAQLLMLYVPGHSPAAHFKPTPLTGKLLEFSGTAPIESAGWALSVSEAAPTALGTALGPGDFGMVFSAGISCQWTGSPRRELAALGSIVAQNAGLVFSVLSGSPPGVIVEQKFALWDDQDTNNQRPCQLYAGRVAGQLLTYALTPTSEIIEYVAVIDAEVDRPVLATGMRIPAVFLSGIVAMVHSGSSYRLYVYSATPDPEVLPGAPPAAYPLALDNALLDVSVPAAIYLYAKTDATFNSLDGAALILFGYLLIELYLPDPYTVGFQYGRDQGSVLYGYLLAEIAWTKPDQVAMRLIDTAHTHPVTPPATEASSTPVPPAAYKLPEPAQLTQVESPALVLEAAIAPDAVAPTPPALPQPDSAFLLLDLSTRASLLGVEVAITAERRYTIDGLSVRGPASFLPLFTLPAIAWEPMYNTAPADPTSPTNELLFPPGDGPLTEVRPTSATLIPISPLQSLQALLNAGQGGFTAVLSLPFGLNGTLAATTSKGTVLPTLTLVQPSFPASSTPAGTVYTGAWQLSIAAPDPTQPDPILAGRSYLRNYLDDPPAPELSYGEQVLGRDVAGIFSTRFDAHASQGAAGVPLRRSDLTGYGAEHVQRVDQHQPASDRCSEGALPCAHRPYQPRDYRSPEHHLSMGHQSRPHDYHRPRRLGLGDALRQRMAACERRSLPISCGRKHSQQSDSGWTDHRTDQRQQHPGVRLPGERYRYRGRQHDPGDH